jgi:hypothetical protein|tara:strand:+ start:2978 stop:3376 length:399 start_codon:yes stop_codon:yes gene_type:complete
MTQATTTEFVEFSVELIDSFIETTNATWVSVSDNTYNTSNDTPYIIEKPTLTETPVKILFQRDDLEDRQLNKYRKETSLSDGQINGWMYAYSNFQPKLKDIVYWQGYTLNVAAIDPVQPIDDVIVYFIEFKS